MRLEEMTWVQASQYFENNDTVLIGVGSTECHGKHNPLGTDTIIPNRLIDMIEAHVDLLIAPTIPYGATDSLENFSGTINLSDQVLYLVLKKITESFRRHGARKFVFMNGHGGNIKALQKICLELDEEKCLGTIINWWLLAWDLNPDWKGGHGGAEETSAIMAINENLVDKEAIESYKFLNVSADLPQTGYYSVDFKGIDMMIPRKISSISPNGWVGQDHPKNASKEWGEKMLEACSIYIAEYINTFKNIEL